jgi:intracellular sulfur oxidation DsrE/DsrF family protein
MRRLKLQKSDLFDFVVTVDSGVAEVVRKQEAGWAYLKGGA